MPRSRATQTGLQRFDFLFSFEICPVRQEAEWEDLGEVGGNKYAENIV